MYSALFVVTLVGTECPVLTAVRILLVLSRGGDSCMLMMSGRGHEGATPVNCTVKPPVYLHIGGATGEQKQSGVCVLDVSLPFGHTVNVGGG